MVSSVCPRSKEAVLSVYHQISALTLETTKMSHIRELSHNWLVSSVDVKKEREVKRGEKAEDTKIETTDHYQDVWNIRYPLSVGSVKNIAH
jgi:hypothetical protein